MALTKVTGQVIKNTTDVTVGVLTVTNTLAVGGTVSVGGKLTYEDVTNVDAVGLITARNGIVVGSGITLSKDGNIFATGVTTSTTFVGNLTGNVTGTLQTAAQSNITSLGSLSSLVVTGGLTATGGNIVMNDYSGSSANRIKLGTSQDLELYHSGSHSFIEHSGTGHLILGGVPNGNNVDIMKAGYSEYMARFKPDSSVDLYYDANVKFQTTSTGVTISGSDTTGSVVQGDFRLKKADATQHIVYDASNARMNFADSVSATFGDGNDFLLKHTGSTNQIQSESHRLIISGSTSDNVDIMHTQSEYLASFIPNGAVELFHNNAKKFETRSGGAAVFGHLELGDNDKVMLGDGNDLQIYHNGSNSYVANSTGQLVLEGDDLMFMNAGRTESLARFQNNGAVELYHNDTKRFETESAGIKSRGTLKFTSEDQNVTHNKNLYYLVIGTNSTSTITLTSLNGTGVIRIGGYANAGQGAIALHIIFGGAMFATQHYQSTELQNSSMQNTSISLSKNSTNYTIAITNNSSSYSLNLVVYLESTGAAIGYAVS